MALGQISFSPRIGPVGPPFPSLPFSPPAQPAPAELFSSVRPAASPTAGPLPYSQPGTPAAACRAPSTAGPRTDQVSVLRRQSNPEPWAHVLAETLLDSTRFG
jgi:hypothetical protein